MLGVAGEPALLEQERRRVPRSRAASEPRQARAELLREPVDAAKVGARVHLGVGVAGDQERDPGEIDRMIGSSARSPRADESFIPQLYHSRGAEDGGGVIPHGLHEFFLEFLDLRFALVYGRERVRSQAWRSSG